MALKNNTWKLNQWYDQDVAGNVSYSTTSNEAWIWGNNQHGQLAQNTNNNAYSSQFKYLVLIGLVLVFVIPMLQELKLMEHYGCGD